MWKVDRLVRCHDDRSSVIQVVLKQFLHGPPIVVVKGCRRLICQQDCGPRRHSLVLRIISPALATVFLIQFVSTWANFLLPTMMLTTPEKQPLAVGLVTWQATIQTGNPAPTNILIFGAFLSVLPLVALFLLLQRYWKTGLTTGGIK